MGRGNVCVNGKYEGLYYVDNDFLEMWTRRDRGGELDCCPPREIENINDGWVYDETESYALFDRFEAEFVELLLKRFPSMHRPRRRGEWVSRSQRVVAENKLFYVCFEDNIWSLAVELIQKQPPYGGGDFEGLQAKSHGCYLKGIREILLDINGEVGAYAGAWTHKVIVRESERL